MKIEIFPPEKVLIDRVAILLGMARSDVERAIGKGRGIGDRCYYFNNEMAIDYDGDGNVDFVEFLGGIDGMLRPAIYGVSAFDVSADELAALLALKNAGEVGDADNGYSYTYKNISVGIYRETRPTDVTEMIKEMQALGVPIEGNPDVAEEKCKAEHWSAIGVGIKGYYCR